MCIPCLIQRACENELSLVVPWTVSARVVMVCHSVASFLSAVLLVPSNVRVRWCMRVMGVAWWVRDVRDHTTRLGGGARVFFIP